MRVDAISSNLQTTSVMPLKNAYVSKISNSETLKTDMFEKQGQKEVAFKGEVGGAIGATLGAIAGIALCTATGPLGLLLAYYGGMAAGGVAGHVIEEKID